MSWVRKSTLGRSVCPEHQLTSTQDVLYERNGPLEKKFFLEEDTPQFDTSALDYLIGWSI